MPDHAFGNHLQDRIHEICHCLGEKKNVSSAHFTFRSPCSIDVQPWKNLQPCRELILPKPSSALPGIKPRHLSHVRNLWLFSCTVAQPTQALRCQQTFWLGMRACLSCGAENALNECFSFLAAMLNHCCSHNF